MKLKVSCSNMCYNMHSPHLHELFSIGKVIDVCSANGLVSEHYICMELQ